MLGQFSPIEPIKMAIEIAQSSHMNYEAFNRLDISNLRINNKKNTKILSEQLHAHIWETCTLNFLLVLKYI